MYKIYHFVILPKIKGKYLQVHSENRQKSFAFFCVMRYNIIIKL